MDNQNGKILSMLIQALRKDNEIELINVLKNSCFNFEEKYYDNWDGGVYYYILKIQIKYDEYIKVKNFTSWENKVIDVVKPIFENEYEVLNEVVFCPIVEQFVDWDSLLGITTKEKLIETLENEKKYLMDVGTGIKKIRECENDYKTNHKFLIDCFKKLLVEYPLMKINSLWDWYNYYKENNLPTYQSRRNYLTETLEPIFKLLKESENKQKIINVEKTGISIIDESMIKLREELARANDRISFNAIGVRCRETIILIAKTVYDDSIHHPSDYKDKISITDSKKMLDGYISYYFSGKSNDGKRKYLKSTVDLANNLTHKQTATQFDARLCYSATASLINLIKIVYEEYK